MVEFQYIIFESILAIISSGLVAYLLISRGKRCNSIIELIYGYAFIFMVLSPFSMLFSYIIYQMSLDMYIAYMLWLLGRIFPMYSLVFLFMFFNYLKSTKLPVLDMSIMSFLEGIYTYSIVLHPIIITDNNPFPWAISISSRFAANLILAFLSIYLIKTTYEIIKNNKKPRTIIISILLGIVISSFFSIFIALDSLYNGPISKTGITFLTPIYLGSFYEYLILRKSKLISSYFLFNIDNILILDKGGNTIYSYNKKFSDYNLQQGAILNAILNAIPEMLGTGKIHEIQSANKSIIINWGPKTGIIVIIITKKPNFGIYEFIKEITNKVDEYLSQFDRIDVIIPQLIQNIKNIIKEISPGLMEEKIHFV